MARRIFRPLRTNMGRTNCDAFNCVSLTIRRKAAVIQAVRGGWVPIEEVSSLYDISADEFLAWERDVDRYGVPGLRATRLQIYRDTDKERRR